MDIKEAKEQLLKHEKEIDAEYISARYSKAIEVVLSELDKKDKIIDLMAEDLMHIGLIPYRVNIFTKEQLIEQYANKVEEDK